MATFALPARRPALNREEVYRHRYLIAFAVVLASVLELIDSFERVTGAKVPYSIAARRPGDVAKLYSSAEQARARLNWAAKRNIEQMCLDSWRYASRNRKSSGA